MKSCSATVGSSPGALYQLSSSGKPRKHCSKVAERQQNLSFSSFCQHLCLRDWLFPGDASSGMDICSLIWTLRPTGLLSPMWIFMGTQRSWSVTAWLSWLSSLGRWNEMSASDGTSPPVSQRAAMRLDHWNGPVSVSPSMVLVSCSLAQWRIDSGQASDSSIDTASSVETRPV